MNIWNELAAQAHLLLTRPQRSDLTPSVTLVQSLHPQPPRTPAAICAHLGTATAVLPTLARYARSGDRHALLMAAVLMRYPLRRIADLADPDGRRSSERDARDNDTLGVFFTLIRTAGEPEILTARYLYNRTLRTVLANAAGARAADVIPVEPHSPVLDHIDFGADCDRAAHVLAQARADNIITALELETLTALFLNTDIYSVKTAAMTLGANVGAVERRAQRAIRKLVKSHTDSTVAA